MYHEKEEKTVITRWEIAKKLTRHARLELIVTAILGPLFAALFLALAVEISNILLYVFFGIFVSIILGSCAIEVFRAARLLIDVHRGRFSVEEDRFCSAEARPLPRRHRSRHHTCEYCLSFASGRNYTTVSIPDGIRFSYSFSFSKPGDPFYLVVLHRAPDKPILIYSGVLFRYTE